MLRPDEYGRLLHYGIGLTDLAKGAFGADANLKPEDFDRMRLRSVISTTSPRIVAFNGKRAAGSFDKIAPPPDVLADVAPPDVPADAAPPRHDFHAFSALRWSDFRPATFGHNERRIDEAFFFIQRAFVAKLVGNVRQNPTQNLVAAPSLKASMHSFVVRIALRQHVPLRACVENPQYRFQHMTGRDRLASRTPIGNMLLRKMLPNALPLYVREPNHSSFIADRQQPGILR